MSISGGPLRCKRGRVTEGPEEKLSSECHLGWISPRKGQRLSSKSFAFFLSLSRQRGGSYALQERDLFPCSEKPRVSIVPGTTIDSPPPHLPPGLGPGTAPLPPFLPEERTASSEASEGPILPIPRVKPDPRGLFQVWKLSVGAGRMNPQ